MNKLTAVVGAHHRPGQGECFVWSRNGELVAVDSGGGRGVGARAGALQPKVLILTHDDHDHIGGAVALIDAARGALQELWVPAEWAILLSQIARTTQATLLTDGQETVIVRAVSDEIKSKIVDPASRDGGNMVVAQVLSSAERNLADWDVGSVADGSGFWIRQEPNQRRYWYGAQSLQEILDRVRKRARPLVAILNAAIAANIRLRLFSIDLALAASPGTRGWEGADAGRPGLATLANAIEAPHAAAVDIAPGLARSYALTRITVQNRRALCTLLWARTTSPMGGAMIWSDTDGQWLDDIVPRGLGKVIDGLSASSAPHHASDNSAHDAVWNALGNAPQHLVVISAGGQWNQGVRAEYRALGASRTCTRCRPLPAVTQEVCARGAAGKPMHLRQACLAVHRP